MVIILGCKFGEKQKQIDAKGTSLLRGIEVLIQQFTPLHQSKKRKNIYIKRGGRKLVTSINDRTVDYATFGVKIQPEPSS